MCNGIAREHSNVVWKCRAVMRTRTTLSLLFALGSILAGWPAIALRQEEAKSRSTGQSSTQSPRGGSAEDGAVLTGTEPDRAPRIPVKNARDLFEEGSNGGHEGREPEAAGWTHERLAGGALCVSFVMLLLSKRRVVTTSEEEVIDSEAFVEAMKLWTAAIASPVGTPRTIKRLLNTARLVARLYQEHEKQRAGGQVQPKDGQPRGVVSAAPLDITHSTLVALIWLSIVLVREQDLEKLVTGQVPVSQLQYRISWTIIEETLQKHRDKFPLDFLCLSLPGSAAKPKCANGRMETCTCSLHCSKILSIVRSIDGITEMQEKITRWNL